MISAVRISKIVGVDKDVKESEPDEDCEKAIRDVLGFV